MKAALVIALAIALAGCGTFRNGGGLIGNKQACGGSFSLHEPGAPIATYYDASC